MIYDDLVLQLTEICVICEICGLKRRHYVTGEIQC